MVSAPFKEEAHPNDVSAVRETTMKMKKEYVLLAAIIIGLSLYLVMRNPDRTRYKLPQLSQISKEDISKLEILKPDTSILLKKVDDKWHLDPAGYLANPDRVENMLNTIEGLALTALVSESGNYNRYDLDDDSKITVKAWVGGKLSREFDIGKVASSYRHTFVKLAGDDRVYHARGNFRSQFDQTVDALRDKTVLSFDSNAISEIRMTKGKDTTALVLTEKAAKAPDNQANVEKVWLTADGKQADEEQLKNLLRTLSNLQCEKYIDDQKKQDLADPIYTIHCKGTEDHSLSVFAKREEKAKSYPAVSSGSDYPFLLPVWQVEHLMKEPEEILTKLKEGGTRPETGKRASQ